MSFIRIRTSTPLNEAFLKAGPKAAWLWVCGLAYCEQKRTGGLIKTKDIDDIGVPGARLLAHVLVGAGLWDAVDGGWMIRPGHATVSSRRPSIRYLIGRLVAWWGPVCVYCGASGVPLEIDHIVPLARGGGHGHANLTVACKPCNLKKRTKTAHEFGHPEVHERAKGFR